MSRSLIVRGAGLHPIRYYWGMLNIDLTGSRALVAGVADDAGFGFAIAKALAEAGASVCVGTWPPALNIFLNLLERGKMDESRRLSSGELLTFEKIYPLDAVFDRYDEIPEDVRANKRYKDVGDCSIDGLAERIVADFGEQSARHRGPLAGERPRSEEAAARDRAATATSPR